MLILASILAIFVYGMIAATLGTILPDLSGRFGLTPSAKWHDRFCASVGADDRVAPGRSFDGQRRE